MITEAGRQNPPRDVRDHEMRWVGAAGLRHFTRLGLAGWSDHDAGSNRSGCDRDDATTDDGQMPAEPQAEPHLARSAGGPPAGTDDHHSPRGRQADDPDVQGRPPRSEQDALGDPRADDHDTLRGWDADPADAGPASADRDDALQRARAADADSDPGGSRRPTGNSESAGGRGCPDPGAARADDDLARRGAAGVAGRQYYLDAAAELPRHDEEEALRPGRWDAGLYRDLNGRGDASSQRAAGPACRTDDPYSARADDNGPGRPVGDTYRGSWRRPGRGEQIGSERAGQGRRDDPAG